MYLTRKSIMLLRKYLLVTEFQVSKCGSHIVKIRRDGRAISETYEI
nr:ribosomal protein L16-like protein [Guaduella macrostachys]